MDLALNNLQRLIYHKTQPTNQLIMFNATFIVENFPMSLILKIFYMSLILKISLVTSESVAKNMNMLQFKN